MNRLEVLGSEELRAVLEFVRSRREPPTTAEAAAELGLSRSVARWRLERLAETGHLNATFAKREGGPGAGRPAKRYEVAPETEPLEFPRRRYVELLRLALEPLPAERLNELGADFGRELARETRLRPAVHTTTALDRVCGALGRLGFQASVESVETERAVLVTPTCPLRPLVVAAPSAREVDQGMWRGLVEQALQGAAEVRCETNDCLAEDCSCRVVVQLSPPSRAG
jgi:predicted ArsR family transcriptional regulator